MISAAGQVPTPDTQARCADLIFEHEGRVIRLEEEVEGCRDTYRLRKNAQRSRDIRGELHHAAQASLHCRSAVFVRAAAEASSKLKKKQEKLGQEQAELQSLRLECYDLGQEFFHQQISVYD